MESFDVIRKLWKKIPANLLTCFFVSLVTGILTHLYMFTNKFPNWDDMAFISGPWATYDFGRWFLQDVHKWICSYSVPALNGVVGIVFLALSACVIVSLLGLRTHTASALIGIAMVTFPSVVSSNMFMFTTAEYDFAVLLAVLAVYFTLKYRFGFIGGCLLMVLSLAIYQSYFTMAASLFLMAEIMLILRGTDVRKALIQALHAFITLAAGMAVYLVYTKTNYTLLDYRGMGSIGKTSVHDYIVSIARAYHRIIQYFVTSVPSYISGF